MHVDRHRVDLDRIPSRFAESAEALPNLVNLARQNAPGLVFLIGAAQEVFACGCVAEPDSPHVAYALRVMAQAHAAMFAALDASPDNPVAMPLGDGEPAVFTEAADRSSAHPRAWLEGFYLNTILDDDAALDALCAVDPDDLRDSPTKSPEYDYLMMDALRLLRAGDQAAGDAMVEALEATDPDRDDVYDRDWTLYLVVHEIDVLIRVATEDQGGFDEALATALENHKAYWGKTKDRRRSDDGFVSVPLTALAAEARSRGLAVNVESPYLALHLTAG